MQDSDSNSEGKRIRQGRRRQFSRENSVGRDASKISRHKHTNDKNNLLKVLQAGSDGFCKAVDYQN